MSRRDTNTDVLTASMDQAGAALQRGDLDYADRIYATLATTHTTNATVQHLGAIICYRRGDYEAALAHVDNAIALDGQRAEFFNTLGCIYKDTKRYDEAVASFTRSLELQPRYPSAAFNFALAIYEQGNKQHTIGALEQVLAIAPRHVGALSLLGDIYAGIGKLDQAARCYRDVIAAAPDDRSAPIRLGELLLSQSRYAEAESLLKTQLGHDPHNVTLLLLHGNALMQMNAPARAIETFDRLLALEPAHAAALNNRGIALAATGDLDGAILSLQQARDIDPAWADPYSNLARILNNQHRYDEAAELCRKAIALKPTFAEAHINLSMTLFNSGDYRGAEDSARRALELKNQHPIAWYNLGNAQQGQAKFTEAEHAFRQCLSLAPENADAVFNLAIVELALGKYATGWRNYFRRPRFLETKVSLTPITPGMNLSGKRILIVKSQGIGDELFFLRFVPQIKAQGAWIAYHSNQKIASILARSPAIGLIIEDEKITVDYTFAVDDLPLLVDMDRHEKIPAPLTLTPVPKLVDEQRNALAALGPPPYFALTWRAGKNEILGHKYRFLTKEIHLEQLASVLRMLPGTLLALQRNPHPNEIERLAQLVGRPIHDLSPLNEDLERMLALLVLISDYIGVSNTNMHLLAGLYKTARVLVPCPPDWRWMAEGDASPWFPGFSVYRQASDGDWSSALTRLSRDLGRVS